MSRPNDPNDLLNKSDPSREFGRNEALTGYASIALEYPDRPVRDIAERAVRVGMVAYSRFDVNPRLAAEALLEELIPNSLKEEQL